MSYTKEYLDKDWRVKENANSNWSYAALRGYVSGKDIAKYTLSLIPSDIRQMHDDGYVHIHDLSDGIVAYCAGWSLQDLILKGLRSNRLGVPVSKPAKHFSSLLGQIMNFFFLVQSEFAGAQSFSSFDTFLSPYVAHDNLTYEQVKQELQTFIYNMNQPLRASGQSPFTNLTLDGNNTIMDNAPVVFAGKITKGYYKDYKKERLMIFKAFTEILTEGDGAGQTFVFPIPTLNINNDFDWDSEEFEIVLKNTRKYGNFYFANFVNSVLDPAETRSMCCRLSLNLEQIHKLHHSSAGLFGSSDMTGSVANVTINLPLIAYESKNEEDFFQKLDHIIERLAEYHLIKRQLSELTMDLGLTPYGAFYLSDIKKNYGSYFANHFSTIGIIGMEEAIKNLFGKQFNMFSHKKFAARVLDFINKKELEMQEKYNILFNLEESPAEGASYRLARKAKEKHPNIILAGTEEAPYLTNGVLPSVDITSDPFELADNQDGLLPKFTSGSVVHFFIDEQPSTRTLKAFIKSIIEHTDIPYFTITPTFSVCPIHGYIPGKHEYCPYCDLERIEKKQRKETENKVSFNVNI